jgi:hypothetical protein
MYTTLCSCALIVCATVAAELPARLEVLAGHGLNGPVVSTVDIGQRVTLHAYIPAPGERVGALYMRVRAAPRQFYIHSCALMSPAGQQMEVVDRCNTCDTGINTCSI